MPIPYTYCSSINFHWATFNKDHIFCTELHVMVYLCYVNCQVTTKALQNHQFWRCMVFTGQDLCNLTEILMKFCTKMFKGVVKLSYHNLFFSWHFFFLKTQTNGSLRMHEQRVSGLAAFTHLTCVCEHKQRLNVSVRSCDNQHYLVHNFPFANHHNFMIFDCKCHLDLVLTVRGA